MPKSGRTQAPSRRRQERLDQSSAGVGEFPGCRVMAIMGGGLGFTNDGQLRVTFYVPPEEAEKALVLRHLAVNPLPLTVDIQVFEPCRESLDEVADDSRRAQLRALGDG